MAVKATPRRQYRLELTELDENGQTAYSAWRNAEIDGLHDAVSALVRELRPRYYAAPYQLAYGLWDRHDGEQAGPRMIFRQREQEVAHRLAIELNRTGTDWQPWMRGTP